MTPANPELQAVLWDFDGTLADTEQFWIAAEYDLVAELGGTWSHEHAMALVGKALTFDGQYILDVTGRTDLTPEWVVEQLLSRVVRAIERQPIPWRPGAVELLAGIRAAGIPCVLVSASYRVLLEAGVRQLPAGSFSALICGDEVRHGKPHPEPYLLGAKAVNADPRYCVAIEDSPTGAASANAAGALVLGVHNLVELPAAPRRVLLPTLEGVDVQQLRDLLRDQAAAGVTQGARQ